MLCSVEELNALSAKLPLGMFVFGTEPPVHLVVGCNELASDVMFLARIRASLLADREGLQTAALHFCLRLMLSGAPSFPCCYHASVRVPTFLCVNFSCVFVFSRVCEQVCLHHPRCAMRCLHRCCKSVNVRVTPIQPSLLAPLCVSVCFAPTV